MKRLVILLFLVCSTSYGQLQINELCSLNDVVLQSADDNYYDWLEIYNNSDKPVQLSNYYLTDDSKKLDMWNFDSQFLFPGEYTIVFASDIAEVITNEQHANFKLSSNGETVYLTDGTKIIDKVKFGKINEDYTYGRLEESSDILTYLATPTPGESNRNSGTIVTNRESGYYVSKFNLNLFAATGQKIYYTTNGDDPTTTSFEYKGAIDIKDEYAKYKYLDTPTTPPDTSGCYFAWKKVETVIPRCRVVSYRVLDDNGKLGKVQTKSYFFQNPHQFPVMSIITDNQNLFNYDTGIYVPGVNLDEENPCSTGNYKMRGDEWERPMSFSYFENEKLVTQQNGGMRLHGSGSRGASQKSLRFYARKNYGINKFSNDFFSDLDVNELNNFIVRATMSDHSMALIKDAVTMECVRGLNLEQTYIKPVVVYINGNYWGLHEIRNRFDEDYFAEKYDLDKDSVDIVAPVVFGEPWEEKYQNMKVVYDFIVANDLSLVENYEYIKQVYDVPQIIDYFIAETYFANTDWPGNNLQLWNSNADRKYKPLFYDLDAGWRDREKDMIEFATQMEHNDYPNPSSTNIIFSKLLSNDEFRQQFIDRALYLIDNEFTYEKIKPIIDKYVNIYRPELGRSIDRWHFPEGETWWSDVVFRDFYEFARLRGCYYKEHLVNHFDLDTNILCSITNVATTMTTSPIITPNPATNFISVSNVLSDYVTIYDIHGTELMKINSKDNNSLQIDIIGLAPSVYFIKMDNRVYKFIKIN